MRDVFGRRVAAGALECVAVAVKPPSSENSAYLACRRFDESSRCGVDKWIAGAGPPLRGGGEARGMSEGGAVAENS